MIKNLKWTEKNVSWRYGDSQVNLTMEKVFLATVVKKQNFVCVKTGMDFKEEVVYFYDGTGVLILCYNILEKKVEWTYEEKKMSCIVPGLNQAMFLCETGYIYILFGNRGVRIIECSGEVVCDCFTNDNAVCRYLSQINDKPVVVCDGENEDEYGRFRMNYYINEKIKILEKGETIP
jgi:hypothetical protein